MALTSDVVPSALVIRPVLEPQNLPVYGAFIDLMATRSSGMSVQAISYAEIAAYVEIFPQDDVELFVYRIRAVDQAFMKWHHARESARKKRNG